MVGWWGTGEVHLKVPHHAESPAITGFAVFLVGWWGRFTINSFLIVTSGVCAIGMISKVLVKSTPPTPPHYASRCF